MHDSVDLVRAEQGGGILRQRIGALEPGRNLGQCLSEDIRLGDIEMRRGPEAMEEVVESRLEGLTRVVALDEVKCAERLFGVLVMWGRGRFVTPTAYRYGHGHGQEIGWEPNLWLARSFVRPDGIVQSVLSFGWHGEWWFIAFCP